MSFGAKIYDYKSHASLVYQKKKKKKKERKKERNLLKQIYVNRRTELF